MCGGRGGGPSNFSPCRSICFLVTLLMFFIRRLPLPTVAMSLVYLGPNEVYVNSLRLTSVLVPKLLGEVIFSVGHILYDIYEGKY